MNNTTGQNTAARLARTFSVSEFMDFGERYGIDYRFPQLSQQLDFPHASPVLQGKVEEMTLPCGMCVTHSDVQVLQPYETTFPPQHSPVYAGSAGRLCDIDSQWAAACGAFRHGV